MQAKDALKMTLDDKRRKRQDELNYRTDLIGAIFMVVATVIGGALVVGIVLAALAEAAL